MKLLKITQKTVKGRTTAKVEFDGSYIIVSSSDFAENGNDKGLKKTVKWFFWNFGKSLCAEFYDKVIMTEKNHIKDRRNSLLFNFMWECDTMHPMRDKFQEKKSHER